MLFIENKYTVLYFRIIEHAKLQVRETFRHDQTEMENEGSLE